MKGCISTRSLVTGLAMVVICGAMAGCEKASHENLDNWIRTQKGPGKLKDALRDADLDPDLRAHAAHNLLIHVAAERTDVPDATAFVFKALESLSPEARKPILDRLIFRLRRDASIDRPDKVPSPIQVAAKDALFDLRQYAGDDNLQEIDNYLVEWLTGGYYVGRARQGRHRGSLIMRTIGDRAAPRLLESAKAIVGAPPNENGQRLKIEELLLVGLAATGNQEAVDFIMNVMSLERNDPDLPQRAMNALYQAFVENASLFEPADGKALVPHLDKLVKIAQEETYGPSITNDAIRLIMAAGPPACIQALIELMTFPHEDDKFLWVSVNSALQCGKAAAIVPVADALPRKGSYERARLAGALWEPIVALDDKAVVAEQARVLLESESWVARIIGVELLGHLALPGSATADAERIRTLSGDKAILRGWYGDQTDVPRRERKKPPRLGDRAGEVAKQLDQLAEGGGK